MKYFTRAEIVTRPLTGVMIGTRDSALMAPRFLSWHAVPVKSPDGETVCGRTKAEDPEEDFREKDFYVAAGGISKCEQCVEMLAHGETDR